MDLPRHSGTTQLAVQQIKADLKQWEREFRTLHSRPPSKSDVQACASIQQLYRDYARLKKRLGKENERADDKIQLKSDPRSLFTNEETNAEAFPIEKNRLLPPQPASPSDDSGGSHISSTPTKPISIKSESHPFGVAPSSGVRRPLQLLSPNNCSIPPPKVNSVPMPSTGKSESGGDFKRKAVTRAVTVGPKKQSLHPIEGGLSASMSAPRQMDFLPACPLAIEGGLVIRLQRQGAHRNDPQSSPPDDPLPAGFYSRIGPSSLVRKDLEACSLTSAEDAITTGDDSANLEPVTIAASSGHNYVKNPGTFRDIAEQPEFVLDQPQFTYVADGARIATASSAVGVERLANLEPDDPSDSTAVKENELRNTICDSSVAKMDLPKITVVDLKRLLLKHGLPLTGNKSTLVRRLNEALPTGRQEGQPSTGENADMALDVDRLSHAGTTCATQTKSLKRKSDDRQHEQLREEIPSTGKGKSLKPARKYSLRSKGLPSAEQHETEKENVSAPASVTVPHTSSGEDQQETEKEKLSAPANPSVTVPPTSSGEGRKVCVVKARTKTVKLGEPLEEQSWGNPKMLRKGIRIQRGSTQVPGKPRQRLALRPGERDNFVRLNINGKGGKGRRFVNGTRTKRPGAYGRRGTHGAKFRKKSRKDTGNGACDGSEFHQEGDCKSARNYSGQRANSLWANDGWLETKSSPEGLAKNNDSGTEEFNAGLKDVVEKAQESPSDENLVELLHAVFGFKAFRPGQLEAIKRILSLQSTMVTLPTGAGKSLCYQLPAHLLPGITLVISPLIALMTDQLGHLPPSLPGALISSAQTPQESSATISSLRAGQVKVLFISPERLFSESFLNTLGELPKISLAVVDEAHCLSEWSHNFRPSYFRLGKVLHQRMQVSCVLAMTATATKKAEQSILKSLRIPTAEVVQASHVRQNLSLSVSREANRLQSLLSLLQSSPYKEARSIIIYCTFQVETDNISGFLEQNSIQAKSYHAKKTNQERSRIYDLFCRNKLRVVVATVAFGMGLDKSDVRAIIHYNMPRSLEHYVQETGRAGRDGNSAHCHLFLDDGDYLKLRSLAFSDGVDEYSVNKFLCRVYNGCSASTRPGNLVSIIIDTASRELDMKEEVMETILSLLEVGEVEYVKVLSKLNTTCTLSFHQSNPASLAGRNTFVAAIMKRSKEKQGRYIFDIPSIATQLQWSLFQVQSELRRLQAAGEIAYEVGDSALCFTVLKIPEDICLLTSQITKRLAEVEQCQVRKLDAMYMAASAAVRNMNWAVPQESNSAISGQQASLQSCIKAYFEQEEDLPPKNVPTFIQANRSFLRADIKVFLKSARNPLMTGRAVARVFHGLWSPAFPYSEWAKSHFWALHAKVDFEIIKEAAAAEILLQHTTNRDDFQL